MSKLPSDLYDYSALAASVYEDNNDDQDNQQVIPESDLTSENVDSELEVEDNEPIKFTVVPANTFDPSTNDEMREGYY